MRQRRLVVAAAAALVSLALSPPAAADWLPAGTLTGRDAHTTTLLPDGRVLVTGGFGEGGMRLDTVEIYDPLTNSWAEATSMNIARSYHTATLLRNGKVLIVAGSSGSAIVASSEIYDPATDDWEFVDSLNTARWGHTATMLRDGRVFVVGGSNPGGAVAQAEVYDSEANSWSPAGTLTPARSLHTATLLTTGKVLVAGGFLAGTGALSSAVLWDPDTNSFEPTASMATARFYATATALENGRVLVTGGGGAAFAALSSTEIYHPAFGTWTSGPSMRAERRGHTATRLRNGKVLVGGSWAGTAATTLRSFELYDPVANRWATEPSMTFERGFHTATLLQDGGVLIAGGVRGGGGSIGRPTAAERYEPARHRWLGGGGLETGRWAHTATQLADGKILALGGYGVLEQLTSAEIYDPERDRWTSAAPMRFLVSEFGTTLLEDGKVLVAGGQSSVTLRLAELYDPASDAWMPTGEMVNRRGGATLTRLQDGRVLAAGGFRFDGADLVILDTAEVYDPISGMWSAVAAPMTTDRYLHAATLLPDGRVLVTGGRNQLNAPLSSAEVYDPDLGTWTSVSGMRSRRGHASMLLENGKVLVAGGDVGLAGPTASADLFDPATDTWSEAAPLRTPRRFHAGTALASGKALVVGGVDRTDVNLWSAELYVPSEDVWLPVASLNTSRSSHTVHGLADGTAVVVGGANFDLNTSLASSELWRGPDVRLSLALTDSPDPVDVGQEVTYEITVENRGLDAATGVVVSDELPVGVSLVSSSAGCTGMRTVSCDIGVLRSGAAAAIELVVQATAPGTATNTATVADDEGDPDVADSAETVMTTVEGSVFSIDDVTVIEGTGGTTLASFTVSRTNVDVEASVDYATQDGSATAPADYAALPETELTFATDEAAKTVTVGIVGDAVDEPDETFRVRLSGATRGTIADGVGVGTIRDDDEPPPPSPGGSALPTLTISNAKVKEGDRGTKAMTFLLTLSAPSAQPVSVQFKTQKGTAKPKSDFLARTGTLTFAPGQTLLKLVVKIKGDRRKEKIEKFKVLLANAAGATLLDAEGVGTIRDND